MSYRDDGDALLARNAALEADNARLREENERLKEPPVEESKALVRKTPKSITVPQSPWYVRGFQVIVWIAAIVVSIATGLL